MYFMYVCMFLESESLNILLTQNGQIGYTYHSDINVVGHETVEDIKGITRNLNTEDRQCNKQKKQYLNYFKVMTST